MNKRLVFVHPDGLHQILGTVDQATLKVDAPPPVVLPPITLRGAEIPFSSLYRVTTRAALYKAPVIPTSANTFHEAQK